MSNVVDEKKRDTFTVGIFNAEIRIDGKVIEAITVEARDTEKAFKKLLRYYPLFRSEYLDNKIGWDDANLLVESLIDSSYEVEYSKEEEPLVVGRHEIEIPLSEGEGFKLLTGTFYERMII